MHSNPRPRTGGKIQVMKELRDATGCSLLDAKNAINSIWQFCWDQGTGSIAQIQFNKDIAEAILLAQRQGLTPEKLLPTINSWNNTLNGRDHEDDGFPEGTHPDNDPF